MKILCFSLVCPTEEEDRNIYSDLFYELLCRRHEVTVFRPDELRAMRVAAETRRRGVRVFGIPSGKITKTNGLTKMMKNRIPSE